MVKKHDKNITPPPPPLLKKIKEDGCMSYASATLEHLADDEECRSRFLKAGVIKPLVAMLGSDDEDFRAVAACVLRFLCQGTEESAKVQEAGALERLESMLHSSNFYTQVAAMGTLRVLAQRSTHVCEALPNSSALPVLVTMLSNASTSINEGAAALIMMLAQHSSDNKAVIGRAEPFDALAGLVARGISATSRMYAALALHHLSSGNASNKDKAVRGGAVDALVLLCAAKESSAVDAAVRCMLTLATDYAPGKVALAAGGALKLAVQLLRTRAADHGVVLHCVLLLMQCATNSSEIQEQVWLGCCGLPCLRPWHIHPSPIPTDC